MALILETDRLFIREFETGDAAFILELLNTEAWIKYIGDRNVHTIDKAIEYLQNGPLTSYLRNGFGLWLVALKENDNPIGMCGLIKRENLDYPDIGFAFLPSYMDKGFAFESANSIMNFAFDKLHLTKVLAITVPENDSSIKLLQKLGMKMEEEITWEESKETLLKFSVEKNK